MFNKKSTKLGTMKLTCYMNHSLLCYFFTGKLEFDNIILPDNFDTSKIEKELETDVMDLKLTSKLEMESVILPGNASVTFINGAPLDELINDMCLINVKCYIPRNITIDKVSIALYFFIDLTSKSNSIA